jgi:exopolysaccharide production protein ExoZ
MADEKIQSLQVLRFVAAAMVVLTHALAYALLLVAPDHGAPKYGSLGEAGVDIFFVLSGVVIYRTAFVRRARPAGQFLASRILRIVPLYFAVTLACYPWPDALFGQPKTFWALASSLTFWPPLNNMAYPIVNAGWTLTFEMIFYLSVAAVLSFPKLRLLLPLVFGAAWYAETTTGFQIFRMLGNPIIFEFLMGMAVGALYRPEKAQPPMVAVALIGTAVLLAMYFCLPFGRDNAGETLLGINSLGRVAHWGIPATLVVLGALMLEPHLPRSPFCARLVYLGDASFAIYLVHQPLLMEVTAALKSLDINAPIFLTTSMLLGLGIAAGVGAYELVDRPVMSVFRRRAARGRGPGYQLSGEY